MVLGYDPIEGEERDKFWNDMDRVLDRVGLNGWIGDRVRAGITGAFGVPEKKL